MLDSPTATRIDAAEVSCTVVSPIPAVTAWALRYFGPWWNAVDVPPPRDPDVPIVVAEVDPSRYTDLAARVTGGAHEQTVYARSPILVACGNDGSIYALSPTEGLAVTARSRSASRPCHPVQATLPPLGRIARPTTE